MHRTIISFVQPQPISIQNKNSPISCGTAPGNLVAFNEYHTSLKRIFTYTPTPAEVEFKYPDRDRLYYHNITQGPLNSFSRYFSRILKKKLKLMFRVVHHHKQKHAATSTIPGPLLLFFDNSHLILTKVEN